MPGKDKENYGPGSFSDQYDNNRMRSMDRDQHPGGVTGTPFEDDIDIESFDGRADKGEAWAYPGKREEPARDADLGRGGTSWNANIPARGYSGVGPRNWKLSDEKLRERVCEVLYRSHEVDPTEMEVKVKEGVAFLSGAIKSRGMKRVAEDLVGSIPGIIDVFSRLEIRDTSNFQLSDKALKEARDTDQS